MLGCAQSAWSCCGSCTRRQGLLRRRRERRQLRPWRMLALLMIPCSRPQARCASRLWHKLKGTE